MYLILQQPYVQSRRTMHATIGRPSVSCRALLRSLAARGCTRSQLAPTSPSPVRTARNLLVMSCVQYLTRGKQISQRGASAITFSKNIPGVPTALLVARAVLPRTSASQAACCALGAAVVWQSLQPSFAARSWYLMNGTELVTKRRRLSCASFARPSSDASPVGLAPVVCGAARRSAPGAGEAREHERAAPGHDHGRRQAPTPLRRHRRLLHLGPFAAAAAEAALCSNNQHCSRSHSSQGGLVEG